MKMKQRRVRIKQVAAEAGVSIATIPSVRAAANDQGNDYSSVAYWYQKGKHADHAELPPMEERLPRRWPTRALGRISRK
jgi:transposase